MFTAGERLQFQEHSNLVAELRQLLMDLTDKLLSDQTFPIKRRPEVAEKIRELEIYLEMSPIDKTTMYKIGDNLRFIAGQLRNYPEYEMYVQQLDNVNFIFKAKNTKLLDLSSIFTPEELSEFFNLLAEFLGVPSSERNERIEFIHALFGDNSSEVSELRNNISTQKNQEEITNEVFNHPFFHRVLELLLKYPRDFAYEIGILANQELPPDLETQVQDQLDLKQTRFRGHFKLGHRDWWMCKNAEYRLVLALDNDVLVLCDQDQEGLILLKSYGKLSGVTLRDFTTSDGQIIPQGMWIAPVDEITQQRIMQAMEDNHQRLPYHIVGGEWALMRGIVDERFAIAQREGLPDSSFDQILQRAKKYQIRSFLNGLIGKARQKRKLENLIPHTAIEG